MNYEKLDLTKRFDNCIDEMCNKYKINENFCLNSKERIDHILNYILINKKIPKPIILVKNNNKNEIADGNHRIAAYRLYKEKNDEKLEKQEVWIGELQNTNYQYGAFFWPQNS